MQPAENNKMVHAIIIEREFGCGASRIASTIADRLGWELWDGRLTEEIARLTASTPEAVERREWRTDPLLLRLCQDFLRGAFEGGLPPSSRLHLLDARRIAAASEVAVKMAFGSGPSVIVGRGSQYFLADRKDVFRVFLYGSRDYKIRRLIALGTAQDDAIKQVDSTDKARATFVRQYLKREWPGPHLFHAMLNTDIGEDCTASMIVECVQRYALEAI